MFLRCALNAWLIGNASHVVQCFSGHVKSDASSNSIKPDVSPNSSKPEVSPSSAHNDRLKLKRANKRTRYTAVIEQVPTSASSLRHVCILLECCDVNSGDTYILPSFPILLSRK